MRRFEHVETGGGCTALRAEVPGGHVLVTDTGGCGAPTPYEPVLLGIYCGEDGEAEMVTLWYPNRRTAFRSIRLAEPAPSPEESVVGAVLAQVEDLDRPAAVRALTKALDALVAPGKRP